MLISCRAMREKKKIKLLPTAIADQRWDIAAHVLVIGLVKAQQKENGKKRATRKSKR